MKKKIAFFDFDGTITTKDTFLEFIKFSKGTFAFYLGFLLNSPYIVAFKLKIISNQKAKEKVLRFFFRGTDVDEFKKLCERFSEQRLPALIRTKALNEIDRLRHENYFIVIVSASPQNWIKHWADKIGVELIASCLEVKDRKITGRLEGRNCHGQEKVRRITQKYIMNEFEQIYAYGDTKGDLPMLGLAHKAFYRPFV